MGGGRLFPPFILLGEALAFSVLSGLWVICENSRSVIEEWLSSVHNFVRLLNLN